MDSTLVSPDRCAVLVVEMQRGVLGPGSGLPALAAAAAEAGIVARVGGLLTAARAAGVPVVHCTAETLPGDFGRNSNARLFHAAARAGLANRPGTDQVRPLAELGPEPSDVVLPRLHGLGPFADGQLDALLRNQGVTTVVVAGVSLNVAIPHLVFTAVDRAYQVVLVADGVVGVPREYGDQVVGHALSLLATVVPAADLASAWAVF